VNISIAITKNCLFEITTIISVKVFNVEFEEKQPNGLELDTRSQSDGQTTDRTHI
jgi:hypothetical protein